MIAAEHRPSAGRTGSPANPSPLVEPARSVPWLCDNYVMYRCTLPHGARGIEGDNFALHFCADKIILVPKAAGSGRHYTIHAGPGSDVLDVHETEMRSGDSERHHTLFAMRHDNIPTALTAVAPLLPDLFGLLRPLRLGWLKHRKIGIARGIDLITDQDIAAVTRKRKRHLFIDQELYQRNIYVPQFLEEVYDFPDGNFALFRRSCRIGVGFKGTRADGDIWLTWIKLTDLMRLGRCWEGKVISALKDLAIPPERYADFPVLQR